MPLKNYGVWVGYPKSFVAETDNNKPHIELLSSENRTSARGNFKAAINIKSSTSESRLVYWLIPNLNDHPIIDELGSLRPGWHPLTNKDPPALDYIRGNLIALEAGTILRHNVPGEKNDIIDYITPVFNQAITRGATIYLFGESFPGGIHDVHMNQGNSGRFREFNGVYQDGGILIHFPDDDHWVGIFLAFGVQKVHTDDETGDPIGNVDFVELIEGKGSGVETGGGSGKPKAGEYIDGIVYIRAALLNPFGDDGSSSEQTERVYLRNRTQHNIDLSGWNITNRNGDRQALSGVLVGQGEKGFEVPDCPLSNRGGTITLLGSNGLKVDGVSYSKSQALREGALVLFH